MKKKKKVLRRRNESSHLNFVKNMLELGRKLKNVKEGSLQWNSILNQSMKFVNFRNQIDK